MKKAELIVDIIVAIALMLIIFASVTMYDVPLALAGVTSAIWYLARKISDARGECQCK